MGVQFTVLFIHSDACLRCQTEGKQEECVGKWLDMKHHRNIKNVNAVAGQLHLSCILKQLLYVCYSKWAQCFIGERHCAQILSALVYKYLYQFCARLFEDGEVDFTYVIVAVYLATLRVLLCIETLVGHV